MKSLLLSFLLMALSGVSLAQDREVFEIWPGIPPGDEGLELPPEADTTKPDGKLIAGEPLIRLGNVATPTLTVFEPEGGNPTGASVIICPGGGHYILALDLEGTEVAEWLNGIGITAFVLKYRVPFRNKEKRWEAAVQDAQRAVSLVRSRAGDWELDPEKIGICGFSAGGETAGLTAIFDEGQRQYEKLDEIDEASSRPDFAMLIYTGGLVDRETGIMRDHVKAAIDEKDPPMFFAHAWDDRVTVLSTLLPAAELKRVGVPTEVHVYAEGGHGYGLRRTEMPVTSWPDRAEEWLDRLLLD